MFKINLGKIEQEAIKKIKNAIDDSLIELKKEVDSNTPIDSGTLILNNKIRKAEIKWDIISWSVYNDTWYAPYVEYWVWGKRYHYHKFWKTFFVWVWARMFTRAYDKMKSQIKAYILKKM